MYKIVTFTIYFLILNHIHYSQSSLFGICEDEIPIENVIIKITDLKLSTSTDKGGRYEFNNIAHGKYFVEISHVGYKTKQVKIEIDSDSVELNFNLDKKVIPIGEATVLSSRSKYTLKEISLPVEVVNVTKLNSTVAVTLSEILASEPGVTLIKDGPWATSVNVRGLSKQNLVYLLDDARIETSTNIAAGLSLIDLNDLKSIEVVKGGLSSLYGTGATGGIVNIQSKKAEFNTSYYITSQLISSYNSVNSGVTNYMNVKSGGDNWSIKLNGSYRNADDTELPDGTMQNSSFIDENFATSIMYSPINDFLIKINFQKYSAYDVGIPGGEPFPKTAVAKYKYAKRDLLSSSISYKNISKRLIKLKLSFYNQNISRSVQLNPNPLVSVNPQADHLTNGISLQSDWYLNDNNYLIAGVDYWQREYEGIRKIDNMAKNVQSVDKPVPNSTFGSLGLYAKDELQLSNKLSLSLSGRYDIISISNEETKNPLYVINNGNKNINVRNELASFDELNETNKSISGSFGALYRFSRNYDFVLNLGYNFRSPSLEERYQYIDLGGVVYLGNPELKPEEGVYFDTGIRIWMDNLNLKINGFINTFSNLVTDEALYSDSIFVKNNIGEARIFGFDANLDFNFYREYIFYTTAAFVNGYDISQERDLAQIPPFNGIVGLILPIKNVIKIDIHANYASDQNNIGFNENRTGGYTYYDLSLQSSRIDVGFANIQIIAGIQNIFNKKYRQHLSTYRGLNMIEPGRNFYAKFIFNLE